jgi:hypothetical protein
LATGASLFRRTACNNNILWLKKSILVGLLVIDAAGRSTRILKMQKPLILKKKRNWTIMAFQFTAELELSEPISILLDQIKTMVLESIEKYRHIYEEGRDVDELKGAIVAANDTTGIITVLAGKD